MPDESPGVVPMIGYHDGVALEGHRWMFMENRQ
jgi:hypothetical protein